MTLTGLGPVTGVAFDETTTDHTGTARVHRAPTAPTPSRVCRIRASTISFLPPSTVIAHRRQRSSRITQYAEYRLVCATPRLVAHCETAAPSSATPGAQRPIGAYALTAVPLSTVRWALCPFASGGRIARCPPRCAIERPHCGAHTSNPGPHHATLSRDRHLRHSGGVRGLAAPIAAL